MKNTLINQKTITIFDKTEKFLLYFIIFFLPLIFLPFTSDSLDFNKQFFLGILVFFSLIFWSLKSFFSSKLELNRSFLNLPVLVLILANLLSLFFSSWRYVSFWGWPLNVSQGFLTVLYFATFYFLIANSFDKKNIAKIISIFVLSVFFTSIFMVLQITGRFIFPWDFTKSVSFNTIGSLSSLGLFIAIIFPIEVCLAIFSKKAMRIISTVSIIFSLFILFAINSLSAWIVLTIASSILFIFGLLDFKKTNRGNLALFALIILIICLSFIAFSNPIKFLENITGISFPKILSRAQFPIEVSLSQKTELKVMLNSFKNIKNLFLGTGSSTFLFNYLKYKPTEINKTIFWNTGFQSGASEALDTLATTGIVGILPLLFIFVLIFLKVGKDLKNIFRKTKEDDITDLAEKAGELPKEEMTTEGSRFLNIGIFSSLSALIIGFFVYPFNLSLYFIFWLILGIYALSDSKKNKQVILSTSLIPPVALTIFLIGGMILSFIFLKNYQAEVKYLSGLGYFTEGKSEEAIRDLKKSIELNPSLDVYWREISQVYLFRLNNILQDQGLGQEEKNSQVQELASSSIERARKAIEISPENVTNWTNIGFIYKSLIDQFLWDKDWIDKTLGFYQKAIELDPINPLIFTDVSRIYIKKSEILKQQNGDEGEINKNINMAKENAQKAVELKPDFLQANFQMAVILQKEGKIKETIDQFEKIKTISPFDQTLAYEIGVFYYGLEMFDLAKIEFERAIQLDSNYSNARYFLGLIYSKEGNQEKAIEQFEKIESLNPDDQEVKAILKALREGKFDF